MKREDAYEQQIVTVSGYGGYATILSIEELPYLGMHGQKLYRATIKWAPNNYTIGRTKYSPVEEVTLGRLTPATMTQETINLDDLNEQELLQLIDKLKWQLQSQ